MSKHLVENLCAEIKTIDSVIYQTSVWLISSFQLARPRMPHGYHRRLKAKEDTNKDQRSSEGQGSTNKDQESGQKGVKGTFACKLCRKQRKGVLIEDR